MSKREQCWQKDKKKNRSWRSCCRMIRFVCASVHFIVLVGQRPPFADVEHNGHVFYEYAFVTRKRDSRQHVMHLPTTQGMKPRLTTSKFFQDAIRHRLIRAWGNNTTTTATNTSSECCRDVWSAIYNTRPFSTHRLYHVQTTVSVYPHLVLAFGWPRSRGMDCNHSDFASWTQHCNFILFIILHQSILPIST